MEQAVAIPPIADLCAFVVYRNEGGTRLAFWVTHSPVGVRGGSQRGGVEC
jgi:hypothetical protein